MTQADQVRRDRERDLSVLPAWARRRIERAEIDAAHYQRRSAPGALALAQHILDVGDDAYLVGHPEWCEIVAEAALVAMAR